MAKTGVFDSDPTVMGKATELKKELQRLIVAIIDDDNYPTDTIDHAKEILSALKELRLRKRSRSSNLRHENLICPDAFRCPLSRELMRDPVVVSTGEVCFSSLCSLISLLGLGDFYWLCSENILFRDFFFVILFLLFRFCYAYENSPVSLRFCCFAFHFGEFSLLSRVKSSVYGS